MASWQSSIDNTNYIGALYSVAAKMHFVVRHKSELIQEPGREITTTIIQFDAEDENGSVRFIINIDKKGCVNTAAKAALILIQAMYRERNIPFDKAKLFVAAPSNEQETVKNKSVKNHQKQDNAEKKVAHINLGTNVNNDTLAPQTVKYDRGKNSYHEKNSSSDPIITINTYKVFNTSRSLSRGECPECKGRIIIGRRNIPVYTTDGNFHAYYICKIWTCEKCHLNIMTSTEWKNLEMRLSGSTNTLIAKPSNLRRVRKNNRYMYEPISEPIIYHGARSLREIPRTQTQDDYDPFSTMQAKSFLKEAGYSTSVSTERRRELLRRLVREHGKRQVTDYLRTFINLHGKRRNYHNAVSIWQSDLNYIARL